MAFCPLSHPRIEASAISLLDDELQWPPTGLLASCLLCSLALCHLLMAPAALGCNPSFLGQCGRWHNWPQFFTPPCIQALCQETVPPAEAGTRVLALNWTHPGARGRRRECAGPGPGPPELEGFLLSPAPLPLPREAVHPYRPPVHERQATRG